ncbi:hypothetical protein [Bacillus wiedmannii]|uniref:Uncharacterized protein n=1 Tax=Bacillus wiedmannii TaxID=1890302 RepID=A0AA95RY03_9BACI|nr:hypothetical protein [Bacillus wiedmannii]WHY31630.1 hypothetical protein QNH45_12955 [Bacillus wiedmannii]
MSKFLILYALLGFMKLVTKENGHVESRSNLNKILILKSERKVLMDPMKVRDLIQNRYFITNKKEHTNKHAL